MPIGPGRSLAGLRVLVVDDELMVASLIEAMLEDLECVVVGPVPTVDQALALVHGEPLDGALIDANLNGRSSALIATELRVRGIPFVVVTGYGRRPLGVEVLDHAPRLTKPFDNPEFERALAEAFLR